MPVTGTTRVVVHLTYPAKHLRTPSLFNPLLERLGHDGVLVPCEVSPDNLASAWAGLRGIENLAGVIVTVPHKIEVAHLCDELLGIAEVLKVCNVARRLPDGRFVGRHVQTRCPLLRPRVRLLHDGLERASLLGRRGVGRRATRAEQQISDADSGDGRATHRERGDSAARRRDHTLDDTGAQRRAGSGHVRARDGGRHGQCGPARHLRIRR